MKNSLSFFIVLGIVFLGSCQNKLASKVIEITKSQENIKKIKTLCRIDTKNELEYYKHGGILQFVLRNMI